MIIKLIKISVTAFDITIECLNNKNNTYLIKTSDQQLMGNNMTIIVNDQSFKLTNGVLELNMVTSIELSASVDTNGLEVNIHTLETLEFEDMKND